MQKLIEDYLAKGGKITVCPPVVAFGVPVRPVPMMRLLVKPS